MIFNRQTLLQLLHVKTLSSEGAASVSALWRLRVLFSSHCSPLFCSAVLIADLVVCRQPLWSAASASKPAGAMPPALRSPLSTSLQRSIGLPVGQYPVAGLPYRMSLGNLPSCMCMTWPSQRSRLLVRRAYILRVPALARTSVLGI